jgi:hypothetical protein
VKPPTVQSLLGIFHSDPSAALACPQYATLSGG